MQQQSSRIRTPSVHIIDRQTLRRATAFGRIVNSMPFRFPILRERFRKWIPRRAVTGSVLLLVVVVVYMVVFRPLLAGTVWPLEGYFTSPLSAADKIMLMDTLKTFMRALESENLTYFIVSGSLIGSFRHHGMVPWDDDIDVFVRSTDADSVERVLTASGPDYALFARRCGNIRVMDMLLPCHWKFFPRQGHVVIHRPYRTPYVDLFLYDENQTHVWNTSPFFPDEVWSKSHVFPLHRRLFEGLMIPTPCDTGALMTVNYDITTCRARQFSHFFDMHMIFSPISVPCERLFSVFPFVRRFPANGSGFVEEVLTVMKRSTRFHYIRGAESSHSVCVFIFTTEVDR